MEIQFSEVARAISYTVTTNPVTDVGTVSLLPADAVGGIFTVDYTGLSFSTDYEITVQASVTLSDGTTGESQPSSITSSTGGMKYFY